VVVLEIDKKRLSLAVERVAQAAQPSTQMATWCRLVAAVGRFHAPGRPTPHGSGLEVVA